MSEKKNKGYRDTLNLPRTSFSMKANLVQREPQLRKRWAGQNIYGRIRQARKGAPVFTLHDGPPYANGDITSVMWLIECLRTLWSSTRR